MFPKGRDFLSQADLTAFPYNIFRVFPLVPIAALVKVTMVLVLGSRSV